MYCGRLFAAISFILLVGAHSVIEIVASPLRQEVKEPAVKNEEKSTLAPGIFKVTPKGDLKDGEYAFFYGGSAPLATYGFIGAVGGSKVFDFGVRSSKLS